MPGYKGHLFGGLVAYLIVIICIVSIRPSFITGCEWLLFTLAGSLFPDVDVKSKGQKYFYYFVVMLFACLLYQEKFKLLSCMSFIVITPMLARHRGIFHKPWFLIALPMIIWAIVSLIYPHLMRVFFADMLFFTIGALSHILLDRQVSRLF